MRSSWQAFHPSSTQLEQHIAELSRQQHARLLAVDTGSMDVEHSREVHSQIFNNAAVQVS